MASGKTDYLEARILNHILGAVASTAPGTVGIALSTAAYSEAATGASMNEVPNSNGYARVSKTNNTTNWPTASGSSPQKTNGTVVTFPTATGGWGNIKSFYIVDSVTHGAGNCLYGGDLQAYIDSGFTTGQDVLSGDTPAFAIGALVVTES